MEELNQVIQEDDGSDLFVEDEPTSEAEKVNEEPTEEAQEPTQEVEPFLNIRYNKEDKALSKEEAVKYAQMGMNYDKVKGMYDAQTERLTRLANANNMGVEDYLNKLDDLSNAVLLNQEIKSLQAKYPNADEGLLQDLAVRNVEDKIKTNLNLSRQKETEYESNIKSQLSKFQKVYPDVDASNLDQKVYDLMDEEGYTLMEAYAMVNQESTNKKIKELEHKANVTTKNNANKAKSLGNTSSSSIEKDDFWDAFMSF